MTTSDGPNRELYTGFILVGGAWSSAAISNLNERISQLSNSLALHFEWSEVEGLRAATFSKKPTSDPGIPLEFSIGSHNPSQLDRRVRVEVTADVLTLTTDYAGSIPVYRSTNGKAAFSNFVVLIEALLEVDTKALDPEMAGMLIKFGHQIWDETSWSSIHSVPPNRRMKFSKNSGEELESVEVYNFSTDLAVTANSEEETLEELHSLNTRLVTSSLASADQIVLPLSSGFDSRLVLAGVSDSPELRERTLAVTYGHPDSIEVRSAEALAHLAGVQWKHIELPKQFLRSGYLLRNWMVFGSGLHMHGMYQMEFVDQLLELGMVDEDATFVTGFMTGVPTGQHVNKVTLARDGTLDRLGFLESFPQSKLWTFEDVEDLLCIEQGTLENRARELIARVPLPSSFSPSKQSMMLDIWTRQRQFIAYHPRVLEISRNVASPHMDPAWPLFFLKVPDELLRRRKLIQSLFRRYYPLLASVPSNSEVISKVGDRTRQLLRITDILLQKYSLPRLVGRNYRDEQHDFDQVALLNSPEEAIAPLPSPLLGVVEMRHLRPICEAALAGNLDAYLRLLSLQSLAMSLSNPAARV